jgi:hypothetical protein
MENFLQSKKWKVDTVTAKEQAQGVYENEKCMIDEKDARDRPRF